MTDEFDLTRPVQTNTKANAKATQRGPHESSERRDRETNGWSPARSCWPRRRRSPGQRDALNAERRQLPMVEIDKDYVFEGPDGKASLLDLFEGRRQLIVGHFMFDPSWDDGCPSCSAGADEISAGPPRSPACPRHHVRLRLPCAAGEDRALQGQARAGPSPGTRPTAATSTTTSTSRSTSPWRRPNTTTAARPSTSRRARRYYFEGEQPIEEPGHELLPARRRRRLPHVLHLRRAAPS